MKPERDLPAGAAAGDKTMPAALLRFRAGQARLWEAMREDARRHVLWPEGEPKDGWHSFDRAPWRHPWLTADNIRAFRAFSDDWMGRAETSVGPALDTPGRRYAFVGNMANNLYTRSRAMRERPVQVSIHLHPQDHLLMSHPAWEEFDGDALEGVTDYREAVKAGLPLPQVGGVHQAEILSWTDVKPTDLQAGMRFLDLKRYANFFCFLPTVAELRRHDGVLAVQSPFLAYLTGRPYAVTQMGGEIWYECSRDDQYGRLQRAAFRHARAYIISNPWSLAFARRYGLTNLVYLPYLIDDTRYAPGEPECRPDWQQRTGGDFFVLITSRLDYYFKGSDVALQGFADFARSVPGARLVITGWGADRQKAAALFERLGIADKVLIVPVAGKKRLLKYLRSADCVLDQLTIGYYGASALEAMGCERPVIMNIDDEQYGALLPEGPPPVCNARTADDVAGHLRELHAHPQRRREIGHALRRWFVTTHGNARWARQYDLVLAGLARHRLPAFADSPLASPLAEEERRYHESELRLAPAFPNYYEAPARP